MDTVTLIYKNEDGGKRFLTYQLLVEQSSTQKWLNIWREFFNSAETFEIKSENPTVIKSVSYYQNIIYELCYNIVNQHNIQLLDGWDDIENYTQDFLNVLHDDFVEGNNITEDPTALNLLSELNHAIHTLEGAMRFKNTVKPSYIKSIIRWPWPAHEWAQVEIDEKDQLDNVNWFSHEHCLFLVYSTLGKNLNMILNDKHYDLIKSDQVAPKTKISPWISFAIPRRDGNLEEAEKKIIQQHSNQKFYDTALQHQSLLEKYNIDYKHWIHKPGRIVIAVNRQGNKVDWEWFMDNSDSIILDEIIFNTNVLKGSAKFENNYYNWKSL